MAKYEPDSHATGPRLFHFRSKTLEMEYKGKNLVFQLLLDHNVDLPTPYIYRELRREEGANEEMEDKPETDQNMQIMVKREWRGR